MNKRSDNNISTERILKSKYLEKDKQKTVPLVDINKAKNKIRLVDLCPEQKLKIGELIKTLQNRRIQNQQLMDQISLLKDNLSHIEQNLQIVTKECEEKQLTILELNQQVNIVQSNLEAQKRKNKEILIKMQQCLRELNRKINKITASTQTQENGTAHKCVGTLFATKETEIQTDEIQQTRNLFYRAHSKSFEKIMKKSFINHENLQAKTLENFHSKTNSRQISNFTENIKRSPDEPEKLDECQSVQQLNKKWTRLKAKNQQALKANYIKKQNSPSQFNVSSQKDKGSWRKSKMEDIDQVTLNKILRLNDFSASKLIKYGKMLSTQKRDKQQTPQVAYLKSPYFNKIERESTLNFKVKDRQAIIDKSSSDSQQQINFYESDLFDQEENKY